jgi:hypothetical protein
VLCVNANLMRDSENFPGVVHLATIYHGRWKALETLLNNAETVIDAILQLAPNMFLGCFAPQRCRVFVDKDLIGR